MDITLPEALREHLSCPETTPQEAAKAYVDHLNTTTDYATRERVGLWGRYILSHITHGEDEKVDLLGPLAAAGASDEQLARFIAYFRLNTAQYVAVLKKSVLSETEISEQADLT